MLESFDLAKTFVHLSGDDGARLVNTTSFWSAAEQRDGLVLGAFEFASPRDLHTSMQEMHPAADEVILLVSGALAIVLDDGEAPRVVELTEGQAAIVPRGVWHHLEMREPGRLVFVNSRTGMQSRPRTTRIGAKR